MSDTPAVWRRMSFMQRDLLGLLGEGPRDGITDKRTANALSLKGLVGFDAPTDTWSISDKGRALLVALKEEGEDRV